MSAVSSPEGAASCALVFYCEAGSQADPPEPPVLPGAAFIRVPCVCRVSEGDLLRALTRGARAVLLAGCEEGACRFHGGDARGDQAVARVRSVIEAMGLPPAAVALLRAGAGAASLAAVASHLAASVPPGFTGIAPMAWVNRALPPAAPFPHHGAVQGASLLSALAAARSGARRAAHTSARAPTTAPADRGGDDLLYACDLPAVETLLGEPFGVRDGSVREAALALSRAAGLRPRVAPALPGCGHDFRFLGDQRTLGALAPLVRDALQIPGVGRVVALCPECGLTLGERYARAGADLGVPVVDLLALLYERRDQLSFAATPAAPAAPAAQRVALFVDVDDRVVERQEQAAALLALAGYEVVARLPDRDAEPGTQGSAGVTGFVACDGSAREVQDRLIDVAERAGAEKLVCTSPFSAVHLGCAVRRGGWRRHRLGVESLYEALASRLAPEGAHSALGPRPK